MNETDLLRNLAKQAAGDQPPRVDVTGRVLSSIRRQRATPATVLWVMTGSSAAAAAALAVFAIHAWQMWLDPITELFSVCYTVIP